MKVLKVLYKCGLCHIGDVMACDDRCKILPVLGLSIALRAYRGCGRIRIHGSRGGTLDPGVHICAVVIAHIHHVVIPFHGTGQ